MATYSEQERRQASKEASAWFVLLQEDPEDSGQRIRFEAWRASSPLNAQAWEIMQRTVGVIARMPPQNTGNWQSGRQHARWWSRRFAMQGVTVLAAAACVALVVFPYIAVRLQADCMTATAETRNVTLADGSTARLAPQSAIAIDYSNGRRQIRLLAGEAFFAVKHDPARPFVVMAGAVRTTDIGTVFDVRRKGADVIVAVRDGRVKVEGGAALHGGQELGAGEVLDVQEKGAYRSTITPDHVGAWGEGWLVADEEPMSDVVDRLRPWLGAHVVMASPHAARHITGVYNLAAPQEALRAVAKAQASEIYRFSSWFEVVR
ncbi:FecR family protein [Acetobacter senegalensis]|uniref:FecR family protein n=1 Tax=Acetobacter senegalensis TaxID=446692 RepID=UPI0026568C08|nr:FecR domain-containing protein [Acetobacter senegalensis]MDN7353904.1 FecR domain-containing protein [Acetobacter senegalensis]